MMTAMTLWMVMWGLVAVVVLAAAGLGVVWLVRRTGTDKAEQDLRRQYAARQIDDEEFRRRLDLLRRSSRPVT